MKKDVFKKTSLIVLGVVSAVIYLNRVESASVDEMLTANVEELASGESGSGGGCGTGIKVQKAPGDRVVTQRKKHIRKQLHVYAKRVLREVAARE